MLTSLDSTNVALPCGIMVYSLDIMPLIGKIRVFLRMAQFLTKIGSVCLIEILPLTQSAVSMSTLILILYSII